MPEAAQNGLLDAEEELGSVNICMNRYMYISIFYFWFSARPNSGL